MAKRTSEDIQREIDQLKNRKKEVLAQERSRARKLRTKRLSERGAILEQFIEDAEASQWYRALSEGKQRR